MCTEGIEVNSQESSIRVSKGIGTKEELAVL